jgi:hypothetical protein
MALTLVLDEQLSDLRSSETAYRFTIENRGTKPVRLMTLTPRLAEGVTLLDVKDSSERVAHINHKKLCDELTAILKSYLMRQDPGARPLAARLFRSGGATTQPPSIIRSFSSDSSESRTIDFEVSNVSDAETAISKWLKPKENQDPPPELLLFEAKLEQLRRLDEQIGAEGPTSSTRPEIATLAAGSIFATTFVFSFLRGRLEPRKYTFSIEITFQEIDSEIVETSAASTSAVVSPHPLLLSTITVVSSVLGGILRAALGTGRSAVGSSPVTSPLDELTGQLQRQVISLETIGGMVVALVIFNIYEHTEFGSRMKMGVGWRSALLVGVLAGLFTDRFIAALSAFVGKP